MRPNAKTVLFLGASTGVGLAALKNTVARGHRCIALCRDPSRLAAIFPPSTTPQLRIVQGNGHDVAAVSSCLQTGDGRLVDEVVTTIGGNFVWTRMTIDDPDVCRKGMATLLEALAELRRGGAAGNPHIVACSTTGLSRFGRDLPLAMMPLYHVVLKVAHRDKAVMEDRLLASGEAYTVVRPSLLVNGETTAPVRVGVEDPTSHRESCAIGYTISREDAGNWIAENVMLENDGTYLNKIASITY